MATHLSPSSKNLRLALVGASGAVGTTMLRLLRERNFPASDIVPFASARSVGKSLNGLEIMPLSPHTIGDFDIALFSAGARVSREWAPLFAELGALVIDNSSAFRQDPRVPLVVSEVNPQALAEAEFGIVANPNCTTMAIMLPLKALHDKFYLEEFVATSFQAAGGAGQGGMEELAAQVGPLLGEAQLLASDGPQAILRSGVQGGPVHQDVLAHNVVPLLGKVAEDAPRGEAYTDEELKMLFESRKILNLPNLRVTPTCVRVPVMVGHSIEVRATFAKEVDYDVALGALHDFPGLVVDELPTPLRYTGRNEVGLGRIRKDLFDGRSLNFFAVGDNLLKGAALNAVQLAELSLTMERNVPLQTSRPGQEPPPPPSPVPANLGLPETRGGWLSH